jgi:DinB superfamily
MGKFTEQYREYIELSEENLRDMKDDFADSPYAPGKWLRKEVLGHLIDSAANNHARFVTAQFSKELMFNSYNEKLWVGAQNYKDASWHDLITLWANYNYHIIHVIDSIPEDILSEPRDVHNLDTICFEKPSAEEPATLEYLINDYFAHMQHHLMQIFS